MSELFFSRAEFDERQNRVRRVMQKRGIELLLVISPINIHYLVGSATKAYQAFQCLFFPLEEPRPNLLLLRLSDVAEALDVSLVQDVRGWNGRCYEDPLEVFRSILREKGWLNKRIGLETPSYYLSVTDYLKMKAVLGEAPVVEATHLIEEIRVVKSPAELRYVRAAAGIADVGLEAIADTLAVGLNELEVAAAAHSAMMSTGGESPPSPMNFVSGERTCYGHGRPTDRVMRHGDFVHAEWGGQFRRYCATLGRHFSLGPPSARAKELHEVTSDACDAYIGSVKAGVSFARPHRAAAQVIAKAGFAEFSLHESGYGIAPGFPPGWGESMSVFDEGSCTLQEGMVISVEPPILIHAEHIGARLIDCLIVHDHWAEVLSKQPRELVVV
ncbi:MAG: M24 family metallopeptidase [Steroidobacteraceae bacterium]